MCGWTRMVGVSLFVGGLTAVATITTAVPAAQEGGSQVVVRAVTGDVLHEVRARLTPHAAEPIEGLPPFQGGAAGCANRPDMHRVAGRHVSLLCNQNSFARCCPNYADLAFEQDYSCRVFRKFRSFCRDKPIIPRGDPAA